MRSTTFNHIKPNTMRILPKLLTAITVMAATAMLTACSPKAEERIATVTNPLPMDFGDPFLLHSSDGKYYMYGTSLADGFEAYVSTDFTTWEKCGQVYKGAQDGQWNVNCFWAPEVYEMNGKFYLFYSANYKENPTNEGENFKIGVAVADSAAGPFRDLYDRPIFNPPYPIIDANVWHDPSTGKFYLYYSRCCYKHPVESEVANEARRKGMFNEVEESWVYGVELKDDFSGVIGEPKLLLSPPTRINDRQAEWESRSVTSGEVNRRWTEGSYIFKDGDTYYIMYSANSFEGKHYAVGYATSKDPLGPFEKAANNPVLQENTSAGGEVMGTGHNMVILMPDSTRLCVYHGRMKADPGKRKVFVDKLTIKGGKLTVEGPTTAPQQIAY